MVSTTRSVLLPENHPCTQLTLQGCLPDCQTYTVRLEFILSERTKSLGYRVVLNTGLPFGEQVFTHCNLSYSSHSSRIARDTCSPRPGLRSYFRSSVCSGHPMGIVNDKWHGSPHRSCQPQQWEWDSSRRFVTRGSRFRIFF